MKVRSADRMENVSLGQSDCLEQISLAFLLVTMTKYALTLTRQQCGTCLIIRTNNFYLEAR